MVSTHHIVVPIMNLKATPVTIPRNEIIGKISTVTNLWTCAPQNFSDIPPTPPHPQKREKLRFSLPCHASLDDSYNNTENDLSKELNINPYLSSTERQQVHDLVDRFKDILPWGITQVTQIHIFEYPIDIISYIPVSQSPYRVSPKECDLIQAEIDKLLAAKCIKLARSPYAVPCLLVSKMDNTGNRQYIYFRCINRLIKRTEYITHRNQNILDCLNDANFISTLDLRSGYHAIPIIQQDKDKTTFVSSSGSFCWTIGHFGLSNRFLILHAYDLCKLEMENNGYFYMNC